MLSSTDRFLTTHVGSLARPTALLEMMREREHGRPYDRAAFDATVRAAVEDVVRRQVDVGLDVVTDGEQGKVSFLTYVKDRLGGFDSVDEQPLMPGSWKREVEAFPEYYEGYFAKYRSTVSPMRTMVCTGPVSYRGQVAVATDIANLRSAIDAVEASGVGPVLEAFMPSTGPSGFGRNAHYANEGDYLEAVGEALREEYTAILDAGFVLQVDDPWLIEILTDDEVDDPAERQHRGAQHVDALNHALRGLPRDRIRLHTCYGLNHGPRIHDLPFRSVVELMLRIEAGAYSFEVANPRHQHEWRVWQDVRLPDDRLLIPGLLGHATSYVEHPELVADMLVTYARLVGRERVIAGADCGYSSRATFDPEVHPTIVWEKFKALAEGARIASERCWP